MNLHELVSQFIVDTQGTAGKLFSGLAPDSSLYAFLPELTLCATIIVLLLVRLVSFGDRISSFVFAFFGSGLALYFASPWFHLGMDQQAAATEPASAFRMEIFTGMLVYDPFTVFMRSVLIGFALLFTVFTLLSGIPDREDGADIYTLVLGGTVGMCLMASANHLLIVFLGVEMASVPSYALAGLLKGRRLGSEAALKYSVFGAGAAGVMLYGISLVAGLLNTAHLPTLAMRLAEKLPTFQSQELMVLALGGLMIAVGLAFKLSAVPFHFWAPDVFEGACAEVGAFLSIASKAAALALLVRVAIGFGAIPTEGKLPGERTLARNQGAAAQVGSHSTLHSSPGLYAVGEESAAKPAQPTDASAHATTDHPPAVSGTASTHAMPRSVALQALEPSRAFIGKLIAFLAAITCTFGNLAAYGQNNIKRLLAYSTIAHAGYMMMPVSALMVMAGLNAPAAESAVSALAIYIVVYLFMNLGAFAIVAFLRNAMRSEEIADYAGLIRTCPMFVICFSAILFSLIGLPPLAGFIGKFAIFAVLADGYEISVQAGQPAFYLIVLLFIGGMNTAVSLFYYLRIVKTMTMDEPAADRRPFTFPDVSFQGVFIWLITAPTLLLILNWEGLKLWSEAASKYLLS